MTLVSPSLDSDAKQFADGGSFLTTGTFLIHDATTSSATRAGGGWRFTGAGSLPGGATVDDATLTITPRDTFSDTYKCTVRAHDSASPGVFADASEQDVWDRTLTTASVAVNDTDVLAGASTFTVDVTPHVQELIDRGDWDAGTGIMVFLMLGNNETDAAADGETTKGSATLAINYTDPIHVVSAHGPVRKPLSSGQITQGQAIKSSGSTPRKFISSGQVTIGQAIRAARGRIFKPKSSGVVYELTSLPTYEIPPVPRDWRGPTRGAQYRNPTVIQRNAYILDDGTVVLDLDPATTVRTIVYGNRSNVLNAADTEAMHVAGWEVPT